MKKNRIPALILAIAVICSAACISAYALTGKSENNAQEAQDTAAAKVVDTVENKEITQTAKDETVYIIAGSDGKTEKIIVSDWIKNTLAADTLSDSSDLANIENVKGNETYTMDANNMCVWDAQGNDIYYQGSIEKELPVNLKVTYMLDGSEISTDNIAGKSGHVTIRFDYENNQYEAVEINGKTEKIYVPFAMLTGMLLDSDTFTNVTVSNGKLINDGNRTAVVGLAFPGLQENLGIDKADFDIPDYVEISADTTDFSLETTMTVATNSVFNSIDKEAIENGDIEGLTASLDQLTDAMEQLIGGSSELYNGLCTLLEKNGELVNGISQLSSGLSELNGHSAELNGGAKQVFETLLSAANTQLKAAGLTVPELTIENYSSVLGGVLMQLGNTDSYAQGVARDQVEQLVRAQEGVICEAVTAAVKQEVTAQVTQNVKGDVWQKVLASAGLTKESYEAGITAGAVTNAQKQQLEAALAQQMETDDVKTVISENVEAQMATAEITALINSKTEEQIQTLIAQNMASPDVKAQISAGAAQAAEGAEKIGSLKQQLDSYASFYAGLISYTDGVASAKNGAALLQSSMPALTEGITALRDGALQLSDGLKEFNEQGVQKLVSAVNGDLGELVLRLQATIDVSKDYRSFSGISDDMDGEVKFIYRTAAIE